MSLRSAGQSLLTWAGSGLTFGRVLTVAFGLALIVRCEKEPILPGGWMGCWTAGAGIIGIKGFSEAVSAGKFQEGLWTYNAALRPPKREDEEAQDRRPPTDPDE